MSDEKLTPMTDAEIDKIADAPPGTLAFDGPTGGVVWMAKEIRKLRFEVHRAAVLAKPFEFTCVGCQSHTVLGEGGYECFYCITGQFCLRCAQKHFGDHRKVWNALHRAQAVLQFQPDLLRTDTSERGDAELHELLVEIEEALATAAPDPEPPEDKDPTEEVKCG